jgi:Na+/proline symporter
VFSVGLLAALMSSADSAMLIPSTMIVRNILPRLKPGMGEGAKLMLARVLVPVITFVSLAIAMYAKTIYFLMNLSWELILMVQGIPFILGLYWRRATKEGALASIAVNLVVWVALIVATLPQTMAVEGEFDWAVWDSIYIAAPPALLAGLITFVAVSLLVKRVNK